jgi:hypothetical protein
MKSIRALSLLTLLLFVPGLGFAAGFKWSCASLYKDLKRKPIQSKDECYQKGLIEMGRLGCTAGVLPKTNTCSSSGFGSQSLTTFWRCEVNSVCHAKAIDFTPDKVAGKPQAKVDCSQTQVPVDFGDIYDLQKVKEGQICVQKIPDSAPSPVQRPPDSQPLPKPAS